MLKVLSIFVLLIVTPHLTFAGIYQCKDADGKIVFTDNPSNLPPGCQADYVGDMPESNMTPSQQSLPDKKKTDAHPPVQTVDEESSGVVEDEYDILKSEAEDLAEQFVSTRKRVYRSTGPRSRNKARRDLKEIKSQKGPMLSKVDKSTLNRSQKKKIREILAKIADE
jgi:hypothetical protein